MDSKVKTKLSIYHGKRDFDKTPEPNGAKSPKAGRKLVVQQHFARQTHFDLRLEIDGVLVSWAVTRGPSANPHDKRLAVRTEDHPLSYGSFEGLIPKPQYGGGTVILWEYGTYKPLNGPTNTSLAAGHIKFEALGHRLKGAWALVRMKSEEKRENWLLIKERDEFAENDDTIGIRFSEGVLSGLSREEIEHGAMAPRSIASLPKTSKSSVPAFVPPQLCGTEDQVPIGKDWAFEMKYDGYRLLIAVGGGEARIYTRSGLDWSHKFAPLAKAAAKLPIGQGLLDGEAVVFNKVGISDFPALVAALERQKTSAVTFVAFDLLQLNGEDIRSLSYEERKHRLRTAVPFSSEIIRYGDHTIGNGENLFRAATEAGAEGIIAKLKTASYRSGRSNDWLKIKGDLRDDVEIIGFMPSLKHESFASLLAAKKINEHLTFVGRIGTGYNSKNRPYIQKHLNAVSQSAGKLFRAEKIPKNSKFIEKPFGAEVRYGGWTADNQMRQARFIAIQNDRTVRQKFKGQNAMQNSPKVLQSIWHITHPDRVLFPKDAITKGDIAVYYDHVQAMILSHLKNRPISLLRVPESIEQETFFQRHPLKGMTRGVEEFGSANERYFALAGEEGLSAAVQFGTIEFHGWNATLPTLDHPDRMIFDLDPDTKVPFDKVKSAAFLLRDYLLAAKLESWPLISGGKGIHIVVPLNQTNKSTDVENFCKQFAKRMESEKPDLFLANMSIAKRKGKIFIDYLRNRKKATAIIPWSVRARPGAPIAAPLSWDHVANANSASDYNIKNIPSPEGWKTFWSTDQRIPEAILKLLK